MCVAHWVHGVAFRAYTESEWLTPDHPAWTAWMPRLRGSGLAGLWQPAGMLNRHTLRDVLLHGQDEALHNHAYCVQASITTLA